MSDLTPLFLILHSDLVRILFNLTLGIFLFLFFSRELQFSENILLFGTTLNLTAALFFLLWGGNRDDEYNTERAYGLRQRVIVKIMGYIYLLFFFLMLL